MSGALTLLMGRSFSGKSTLAAELSTAVSAVVLSYDAINEERGLRGGDGIPIAEWARTSEIAHERANRLVHAGRVVIVDDTSSLRFLRDEWRALAARADARFLLVFIDVDDVVVRQRLLDNRTAEGRHDVRDEIMTEHLASFEPPGTDEPHVHLRPSTSTDDAIAEIRDRLA